MAKQSDLFTCVDVGTSKVVALIVQKGSNGLDIIGVGKSTSHGIKTGLVINIDQTVRAIQQAVEDAEQMAATTSDSVIVSISGAPIRGFNSKGLVAVRNREVGSEDVRRVIEAARAIRLPEDRTVIHTLPQGYVIDNNDIQHSPVGMAGVRMETKVHIVTSAKAAVENLMTCCTRNELKVDSLVLGGLASSESVLTDDEKELGVVLADIGDGTTDIVVWHNNAVIHTASAPYGGHLISSDIAIGLSTPRREAERVKIKHGVALCSLVEEDDQLEVPGTGGREPINHQKRALADIIEPRLEEMMGVIFEEIQKSGFADLLGAGVVLTGGTAKLPGICELAESVFHIPVRFGKPHLDKFGGLVDIVSGPEFATAVGLTNWADKAASYAVQTERKKTGGRFEKMKNWLWKTVR